MLFISELDGIQNDRMNGVCGKMPVGRKFLLIAACIIITAIIIVICVECFSNGQPSEFDGTLVNSVKEMVQEG